MAPSYALHVYLYQCCTETHADIQKYKYRYKKVNHPKNKYFSKCYMLPGWNLIFYLFGYYTKSYTGGLYKKNMHPYISGYYKIKIPTGSLSTKGLYLPCVIVSIFVLPVTEWPSSSISLLEHYFHQDAPCWSFKLYYLSKVSPLTTISLWARTLMYEW